MGCGLKVNPKLTFLSNSVARVLLQLINDFTRQSVISPQLSGVSTNRHWKYNATV